MFEDLGGTESDIFQCVLAKDMQKVGSPGELWGHSKTRVELARKDPYQYIPGSIRVVQHTWEMNTENSNRPCFFQPGGDLVKIPALEGYNKVKIHLQNPGDSD